MESQMSRPMSRTTAHPQARTAIADAGLHDPITTQAIDGYDCPPRRRFMRAAICAPAAAIAATTAGAAAPDEFEAGPEAATSPSSYHETDHIRTYYALAAY